MHLGNRAARGVAAGRAALVEPAVYGHGQGIDGLAGLGHGVDVAGHVIGREQLLRSRAEDLAPASGGLAARNGSADLVGQGVRVRAQIRRKRLRGRAVKQGVCLVGDLARRAEQTRLVFHLHGNHGLLPAVVVLQKTHKGGKGARVGLHRLASEIGQRGIGHLHRDRGGYLAAGLVLALFDLRPGEADQILLDPGGGVHAFGVFPASEPQKDDPHPACPGLVDQRLRHGKVEHALFWLDQLPACGQQQRVHAKPGCKVPDPLHIRRAGRVRVVDLACKQNKGPILDHQNRVAVLPCDMWDHG